MHPEERERHPHPPARRHRKDRARVSESLPESARIWVAEAAAASAVSVWTSPQNARMLQVPQLPPARYFAELGEEVLDWGCHVKCSKDLPAALGLQMDYCTLLRLVKADFIASVQPTPGRFLIDLTSLHQFLLDARDASFWTPARRERFRVVRAGDPYV